MIELLARAVNLLERAVIALEIIARRLEDVDHIHETLKDAVMVMEQSQEQRQAQQQSVAVNINAQEVGQAVADAVRPVMARPPQLVRVSTDKRTTEITPEQEAVFAYYDENPDHVQRGKGPSIRDIAAQLGIGKSTVNKYKNEWLAKHGEE